MNRLTRFTLLFLLAVGTRVQAIDNFDIYRYELEFDKSPKVCAHMGRVFNEKFRRPWDYRNLPLINVFKRFDGVERSELLENRLRYSAFPKSPEFDAIVWRQGLSFFSGSQDFAPTLVGEVDIDNDGVKDLVIKTGFMLSIHPEGGSAPGGSDRIFILPIGALDAKQAIEMNRLYGTQNPFAIHLLSSDTLQYSDQDRPNELSSDYKNMGARFLRPFLLDGQVYVAAYVQVAVNEPKTRREWMWVIGYKGGGERIGPGAWTPAQVDKICRYRMIVETSGR